MNDNLGEITRYDHRPAARLRVAVFVSIRFVNKLGAIHSANQAGANMNELLKKTKSLTESIDDLLHGQQIPSDEKCFVPCGCFDVVLEHRKAIVNLIEGSLFGSAFSLVRPVYETYIRGLWLLNCASESEMRRFLRDRIKKDLQQLIDAIEKCKGYEEGVLSEVKSVAWNPMCSYTHGGWRQIGRRFNGSYIEPNYDSGEVIEVLNFVNVIGIFIVSDVARAANNNQLLSSAVMLMSQYTDSNISLES